MTTFHNITSHTRENPPKGYVGYMNFSRSNEDAELIRISMRPHAVEGSGTTIFVDMPADQVLRMAQDLVAALSPKEDAHG